MLSEKLRGRKKRPRAPLIESDHGTLAPQHTRDMADQKEGEGTRKLLVKKKGALQTRGVREFNRRKGKKGKGRFSFVLNMKHFGKEEKRKEFHGRE